jgi:NADPH-dependent 2,4-dienoyl-CoA reductase/sulfur reductase-like enzyme
LTSIVVVGASLAGTQAAQTIRRAGYDGALVMIGDEAHYPYDRPPLSKNYLVDEQVDEDRLRLRPVADPEALGVDWRLGRSAVGVDTAARELTLDDGETLRYDGMVVATGARPRPLPGQGTPPTGVFELRSLDDARRLRAGIDRLAAAGQNSSRLVVCGAGFIGAEVAASARQRGIDVALIDAADTPLDRVLDRPAGEAVADLHRQHGVDVRLGAPVTALTADGDGHVSAVELGDGTTIEANTVVVGIGVVPNTEWLDSSGLATDNGVVVDQTCLAGPGVVAAGDVARWPNARFGDRLMRVEQWDNAVEMGMHAGRTLLADMAGDQGEAFSPVPWFWSDQYDRKIQLAGLVTDDVEMVQGSFDEQRFVQIYRDGDDLVGALCWNRPRQAIQARQLIGERASVAEAVERLG